MINRPTSLIRRYARPSLAFTFEPESVGRAAMIEHIGLQLVVSNDNLPTIQPSPRYHTGD